MTKYVLSVDPGKATGVVFMSWNGSDLVPNVILSKEVQPEDFALVIETVLNTQKQQDDFTDSPQFSSAL